MFRFFVKVASRFVDFRHTSLEHLLAFELSLHCHEGYLRPWAQLADILQATVPSYHWRLLSASLEVLTFARLNIRHVWLSCTVRVISCHPLPLIFLIIESWIHWWTTCHRKFLLIATFIKLTFGGRKRVYESIIVYSEACRRTQHIIYSIGFIYIKLEVALRFIC